MSHNYSIISCTYTTIADTAGNILTPNPLCSLVGTVDGVQTNSQCVVTYFGIMQANAVGGAAAVKLYLAPVLLNNFWSTLPDGHTIGGPPYAPEPIYSAAVSPATPGTNVSVAAALVGSWTA